MNSINLWVTGHPILGTLITLGLVIILAVVYAGVASIWDLIFPRDQPKPPNQGHAALLQEVDPDGTEEYIHLKLDRAMQMSDDWQLSLAALLIEFRKTWYP